MPSAAQQKVSEFAKRSAERLGFVPLLGPFLLGPLIYTFPVDWRALIDGYSRYVAFVVLFLGWTILLRTLLRIRLRKETEDKSSIEADAEARRKIAASKLKKKQRAAAEAALGEPPLPAPIRFSGRQKAATVAAIVVMLLAMEIFRGYFQESIFLLLLATLSCGVLGELWSREPAPGRSKYLLSLTPKLLYFTGIGYLSCLAIHGDLQREPLVLAAGMAAMAVAPGVFDRLVLLSAPGMDSPEQVRDRRLIERSLALLVVFGPLSVALLVYSERLPMRFLLVFASLAVGSRLLQRVPRGGEPVDGAHRWLSILTSVAFLGVFLLLRIL